MKAPNPKAQHAKAQHLKVQPKLLAGWLAVLAVGVVASILAVTANPPPATEAARAAELKENTLCPVCDGQNVLESNAPVASAIRRQIDKLVGEGRSNTEIRARLASQYGDDVNALPPSSGWASLVWVVPVAGFLAAAAGLVLLLRRRQSAGQSAGHPPGQSADQPATQPAAQPAARPTRRFARPQKATAALTLGLIVIGAIAIGVVVARSAGLARPGETITGEINRSARSLLFEAENLFAQGEDQQARDLLNQIQTTTTDLPGAFILSARLFEREGEVLSALQELDRVLEDDPTNVDALALRGWWLVRIDDAELQAVGIQTLDAAIAQEPDQFDPWVYRGFAARVIEGDLPLAIELYEAALQRNPPAAMSGQLNNLINEMRAAILAQPADPAS